MTSPQHPNPWLELPTEPPFILEADRAAVDAYNQKASPDRRIQTDLLPEPWVGRIDAPIVLLLLNPGVSEKDFAWHERTDFRDRVRQSLRQGAVPNHFLDPAARGGGALWTARILGPLLKEFGVDAVANGVMQLEYLPYHSRRFAHHRLRLSSQEFTFELLRSAIRRSAAIFVTRGKNIWEDAVPELRGYPRAFGTRSKLNVVISPRNSPEGYEGARLALQKT